MHDSKKGISLAEKKECQLQSSEEVRPAEGETLELMLEQCCGRLESSEKMRGLMMGTQEY